VIGLQAGADIVEGARGYASLNDHEARAAFVHTIRAVIDPMGQRISALDRLYLAEALPSLIVWGDNDPIIPPHHGEIAHRAMPESRFELIEGAGHFPQVTHPVKVARLLSDFMESTVGAEIEAADMRELVLARMSADVDAADAESVQV
jgi:pimeloyl-ACP methyl ester carboxylesterase